MTKSPMEREGEAEDKLGIGILKALFGAFLDVSGDYMGLASNTMLYRAGEIVGEEFSPLSYEELSKAFLEIGMHVIVQENMGQWVFVVENSMETSITDINKYEPHCHMLRGFFSAYIRSKSQNPYLRCVETECSSTGGDFCRFLVSP